MAIVDPLICESPFGHVLSQFLPSSIVSFFRDAMGITQLKQLSSATRASERGVEAIGGFGSLSGAAVSADVGAMDHEES